MVDVLLRGLVAPFQGQSFPGSHVLGCCWGGVGVTDRWSPCLPPHTCTHMPPLTHMCIHMNACAHVRTHTHTHVLQLSSQTMFSLPQQSCHIAGQHLPTMLLCVCEDRPAPSPGLAPPQALGTYLPGARVLAGLCLALVESRVWTRCSQPARRGPGPGCMDTSPGPGRSKGGCILVWVPQALLPRQQGTRACGPICRDGACCSGGRAALGIQSGLCR